MIVTPTTKSITTYTLELSEEDAAQIMNDPEAFSDKFAKQLRGYTDGGSGQPRKTSAKKSHHRVKAGRPTPKVIGQAGKGADCPRCGKTLTTQGMLARHLRQKHSQQPQTVSASAAESSSTN